MAVLAIQVFLLPTGWLSYSYGNERLTRNLRDQALPRWEEYKARVSSLGGDIAEVIRTAAFGTRPALEKRRRIRFCFRDGLAKFEITREPGEGELTVYAQNSRDRFEVDRDRGGLGLYVGNFSLNADSNPDIDTALDYYFRLPLAGLYIDGSNVLNALKNGQLTVTNLGAEDRHGKVAASLVIQNGNNFNDYKVMLSPEHWWLITDWQHSDETFKIRGAVTYFENAASAIPYPKAFFDEILKSDGSRIVRRDYSFEEPKPCTASDESFTLASYGLEPVNFQYSGGKLYRWRWPLLASNAAVIAVLMLAIWRRLRRSGHQSK